MSNAIRSRVTLVRIVTIVTLIASLASHSPSACAQRVKTDPPKGKHLSNQQKGIGGAITRRFAKNPGRPGLFGPDLDNRPNHPDMSDRTRQTMAAQPGDKIPAGRKREANFPVQPAFGPHVKPSPFFGQDQETGEIIDFRANRKNRTGFSQTGPGTHSVVDSEGWDEVPEELLFAFRSKNSLHNYSANRQQKGVTNPGLSAPMPVEREPQSIIAVLISLLMNTGKGNPGY